MRPRALDHALDGGGARCTVAHVDLFGRDLLPGRATGRHDRLRRGGIAAVEERDVHSLGGEQLDDRAADAAAAAVTITVLPATPESSRCIEGQPEIAKPPSTTSV